MSDDLHLIAEEWAVNELAKIEQAMQEVRIGTQKVKVLHNAAGFQVEMFTEHEAYMPVGSANKGSPYGRISLDDIRLNYFNIEQLDEVFIAMYDYYADVYKRSPLAQPEG